MSLVTPPINLFLNAALSFAETVDGATVFQQSTVLCNSQQLIDKLAYADDIEKLNSQEHLLQADTDELVSATEAFGMVVNTAKTKVMRVSGDPASRNVQLTIKGEPVENVDSFVYLGSLLTSDNCA